MPGPYNQDGRDSRVQPQGQQRSPQRAFSDPPAIELTGIQFAKPLNPDLFAGLAENAAQAVAGDQYNRKNKPSQIRKFYDELTMWQNKVQQKPEAFSDYLPFIKMLNAKVAYAQGRDLVDANFAKLMTHCLGKIDSAETLNHCKLFLEAFLGYYKAVRPKD